MKTALVVGGTGPTGPHIVNGLLEREFNVTILHTGAHESEAIPENVEHIHTDPFDAEKTKNALGNRTFDLAIVMYGRLRELAALLAGRTEKFVSVGGVPAYTGWGDADALWPAGMRVPTRETARLVVDEPPGFGVNRKVANIGQSEVVVLRHHPTGSHLRYPWIYGPGQVGPREWKIVRRILDGRQRLVLPDGGASLQAAAFGPNAAAAVLAVIDGGDIASGQIYNVCDEWTPTLLQWVEIIADALNHQFEIINIPWEFATVSHHLTLRGTPHHRVTSSDKALFELGYRDVVDPVDALAATARHLAANPIEQGSGTERSLGDRFDYAGEDRLIEAWLDATKHIPDVASEVDPGFVDRYAADFDDSKRTGWTTIR
jgi:nucleoside-diphosphate-sugar epimerase